MRLFPIFAAALVVTVLYFWIVDAPGASETEASAEPVATEAPPVAVVAFSAAAPVRSALVLRGRTEAARKVDVKAETAGLIVSQPRRAGARVSAGDMLCQIDRGSREAELVEAQARLAQAQVDTDATTRLAERGYAAETTAMARKAQLEAASAAVRRVELDIERLEITAPFDGVLETDTAEIGALLQPGATCATVISLHPIKIIGFAPETDVDRLKVGAPAGARLTSGREVRGEISFVSRSADLTTRTFKVEITVDNEDETIRDGLSADILIPLSGETAHLTPQAAMTLDDSGRLGVRVVENDVARFYPVDILRDEVKGVYLTGLPDEADIIIVGQEYVSDGRAVETTYTEWSAD